MKRSQYEELTEKLNNAQILKSWGEAKYQNAVLQTALVSIAESLAVIADTISKSRENDERG